MKTNSYIILVLLSAPVALVLGASLPLAFTVFVTGCLVGLMSNDYAPQMRPVRIRETV